MRGNTHVRFGGRTGKTERPKGRHRVPVRPYDLSRQRLDVHVLDEEGRTVEVLAIHPDADALRTLANRILCHGQEVSAVIESMTGSRFVHDQLERWGWDVAIADPVKAKGLAPLAAKTDKISIGTFHPEGDQPGPQRPLQALVGQRSAVARPRRWRARMAATASTRQRAPGRRSRKVADPG